MDERTQKNLWGHHESHRVECHRLAMAAAVEGDDVETAKWLHTADNHRVLRDSIGTVDAKAELLAYFAEALDVPLEILTMTDQEFHRWLHTTDEGRALLAEG